MSKVFIQIVNMGISASWIILAVLILRLLLKKAPKWSRVLLWGIVAARLILPVSVKSIFSLIPSPQTVSPDIMMSRNPEITTGVPILNNAVNPIIADSFTPNPAASANPLQILIPLLAVIWLAGCAAMLLYMGISYLRLRRRMRDAFILRENIFLSDKAVSPFVLGIIKPKIYLPSKTQDGDMAFIISHEQAHLRRGDHIWKPLGFLLLTLHWFNPLMWIAYILLCRDIELACDEKVIRSFSNEQRADYSDALLSAGTERRLISACPLAFGEVGVRQRIKNVLRFRKPAFGVVLPAALICILSAVCFLTDPLKVRSAGERDLFGHSFCVDLVVYQSPFQSFGFTPSNSPQFSINSDHTVYSKYIPSDTLEMYGELDEIKLTVKNFEDYFFYSDYWKRTSASSLRTGNYKAWRSVYGDRLCYILLQTNGDVYAALGYYDSEGEIDPYSDDSSIKLLFKLERTDLLTCTVLSGNASAHIEPVFYPYVYFPDRNEFDYTSAPECISHGDAVLEFSAEFDTKTLIIKEEYHENGAQGEAGEAIYELSPDMGGKFSLTVPHRNPDFIETAYYRIEGKSGVYLFKAVFLPDGVSAPPTGDTLSSDAPPSETGALIATICSSPAYSSSPGGYIEAHPDEYAALVSRGADTLAYCYTLFLEGGQTGLEGHIMMSACGDIAQQMGEQLRERPISSATGQEWFDSFKENAEALSSSLGDEEIQSLYPASALLLSMIK